MHTTTTIAALSLLAPYVAAHGHGHQMPIPRVFGARHLLRRTADPQPAPKPQEQSLVKKAEILPRAADPDTCGPGIGSCSATKCCSSAGYCGTTKEYCAAPDCQINYGPACDANNSPPGSDTSTVARTKVGSVLYGGGGIYQCTVPGTVAITYDDGPYIYTKTVLDLFDKYNAKATFFITANNLGKGPIDDPAYPWYNIIKRMDSSGHQIASHTWSHQDLSAITAAQRMEQIYQLEGATRNILGKFPTYMRPPYSSCNADCQTFLGTAGYHIIYFDQDTSDYLFNTPDQIQISKDYITTNLTKKGNPATDDWLNIAHDIQDQTANNLTEFMLKSYTDKGFRLVTVGECLGDPVGNWYRTASGAGTYSAKPSSASATASVSSAASKTSSVVIGSPTGISKDATCGSKNLLSCLGTEWGNCCSAAGWCGSTDVYCGSGCQLGYGNCGSNAGSAVSSLISTTSKSGSAAASDAASGTTSASITSTTSGSVSPASGTASKASAASSAASPRASLKQSQDSTCGATAGLTCIGFAQGECCSQYGYCGNTNGHCGDGCQKGYGKCAGDVFAASSIGSVALSPTVSGSSRVSSAASAAQSSGAAAAGSSSVAPNVSSSAKASSVVSSAQASSSIPSSAKSPFSMAASSVRGSLSAFRPSASASPTPSVSTDKKCGSIPNQTCTNSIFGTCCIQFSSVTSGTCYSGTICTMLKSYCQEKYGKC